MKRTHLLIIVFMALLLTAIGLQAQQVNTKSTGRDVIANRLITLNGTLKDASGQPRLGTVGITLTLYATQEGGEGLWRESQTVQMDEQGQYTILLGSTEKQGLPLEVFSSGKAQWLGVQVQGEEEQPRVLLVAVPYALKAADADTVGGKPLSSFVLYADLAKAVEKQTTPAMIVARSAISGVGFAPTSSSSGGAGRDARALADGGSLGPFYGHETDSNTWYGQYAGNAGGGSANSYFGQYAGYSNSTACCGTFLGSSAGRNNTTGNYNIFIGFSAGYHNSTGSGNVMVGSFAGDNSTGDDNAFFGANAGFNNTTASGNSFFGSHSGVSNRTGTGLAFFGYQSGRANTGSNNSFFGYQAGLSNTTAGGNSFFGMLAGQYTTSGWYNFFAGTSAGLYNTTGGSNTFVGADTGLSGTVENCNSVFGRYADVSAGITNATAIGYQAKVTQSNSLVLGSINGVNGATASTNVGIGTTKPDRQLVIEGSQAIARFTRFMHTADVLAPTFAPAFLFERARGTQAAPADIIGGDYLGKMQFRGRVGGNMLEYGALTFISTDINQNGRLAFVDRDMLTERVSFLNSGNVGIGTTNPTERLQVVGNLKVSGNILYGAPATEVPDYVFGTGYKLMPIQELEKFISQEKHLPNVPKASEIKEKGLNLSEFQMKLLEKIEELTLYTVQQAKTIEQHKTSLNLKDAEISALNARLSTIEQMLGWQAKER